MQYLSLIWLNLLGLLLPIASMAIGQGDPPEKDRPPVDGNPLLELPLIAQIIIMGVILVVGVIGYGKYQDWIKKHRMF